MKLNDVMREHGTTLASVQGGEMLAECMADEATPYGTYDGVEVYRLGCGNYYAECRDGSAHAIRAEDIDADGPVCAAIRALVRES